MFKKTDLDGRLEINNIFKKLHGDCHIKQEIRFGFHACSLPVENVMYPIEASPSH
mgnify:FL=1